MVECGCKSCFKGEAEAVWKAHPFERIAELVDDSHFGLTVAACRSCGQRYVRVFTEFVDWSGGDDAQYWYVIPVTHEEAGKLIAQGGKVNTKTIDAMSKGRRVLQVDHPTGGAKRVLWTLGPVLIVEGH